LINVFTPGSSSNCSKIGNNNPLTTGTTPESLSIVWSPSVDEGTQCDSCGGTVEVSLALSGNVYIINNVSGAITQCTIVPAPKSVATGSCTSLGSAKMY
jgi:hypothetical protein